MERERLSFLLRPPPLTSAHRAFLEALDAEIRRAHEEQEEALRLYVWEAYELAAACRLDTRRLVLVNGWNGAAVYFETFAGLSDRAREKVAGWLRMEPRGWPYLGG